MRSLRLRTQESEQIAAMHASYIPLFVE